MAVNVFFDGASSGNGRKTERSRAGYGVVVINGGRVVKTVAGRLPDDSTNNIAEWTGAIAGMQSALALGLKHINLVGDSELVIKQLTGSYRVRAPNLIPMFVEAKRLAGQFDAIKFMHVYRNDNTLADAASNIAMDLANFEPVEY